MNDNKNTTYKSLHDTVDGIISAKFIALKWMFYIRAERLMIDGTSSHVKKLEKGEPQT